MSVLIIFAENRTVNAIDMEFGTGFASNRVNNQFKKHGYGN